MSRMRGDAGRVGHCDWVCTSSRRWTRAMLSPRNSLRATKERPRAFATSLAGIGGNEGESNSGRVGGSA